MNPKTTLIAAVVTVLLGGYIYFFEREPLEETASEREEVFDIEAENIREIEIRRTDGENVKLEKEGDSWKLVSPIESPADSSEVDTLTRNIDNLERQRVVAEGDTIQLEDFGLEKPDLEVYYKSAETESSIGFLLGDETPTGSNRYAKLAGENKVFVVSSYLKGNFDKKAWDLRDKKILRFDSKEVEKIVLRRPEGELVLAKASEDRWNVASPGFCRADRYKASSLASRFETAKMEEIVSESTVDLEPYGLTQPSYQLDIELSGGKSASLQVGREKEDRFYARNPDRDLVFLVASSLVDDIKKDASEYRSKRLFEYATYQVNRFQIAAAAGPTQVFEKKKDGEDEEEKWVETAPDARDLDRSLVEDLLYKLNGTDAEDFASDSPSDLEPYGLVAPAFTITVWSKDSEGEEEVAVGKPEGEWVYARRQGDQPVLKLRASDWEEIEKLMSLEEKQPEEGEEKDS